MTEAEPRFCGSCGAGVAGGSAFCSRCGHPIGTPPNDAATSAPAETAPAPTPPAGDPQRWTTQPSSTRVSVERSSGPLPPAGYPHGLAMLGAALLVFGSFMPWISVTAPFIGTVTKSGMEGGDGWVTLIAGCVAGVAALRHWGRSTNALRNLLFGSGVIAAALTIYEFVDVSARFEDMRAEMNDEDDGGFFGVRASDMIATSYGVGLFSIGAGSAAVIAAGVMANKRRVPPPALEVAGF